MHSLLCRTDIAAGFSSVGRRRMSNTSHKATQNYSSVLKQTKELWLLMEQAVKKNIYIYLGTFRYKLSFSLYMHRHLLQGCIQWCMIIQAWEKNSRGKKGLGKLFETIKEGFFCYWFGHISYIVYLPVLCSIPIKLFYCIQTYLFFTAICYNTVSL